MRDPINNRIPFYDRVVYSHILFLSFFALGTFADTGLSNPPVRLAIVEEDSTDPDFLLFSDLLFAEMSLRQDLELVDRKHIKLILEEHDLSAEFSPEPDQNRFSFDHLFAADAILLLSTEMTDAEESFTRARLLNTHLGLKLFDVLFETDPGSDATGDMLEKFAAHVAQHIGRFNLPIEDVRLIGVSTFRSEEESSRWQWLSDTIPGALERYLSLHQGVVLMERHAVAPLLEERRLVSTLPESIHASSLLVDGSFRINHETGELILWIRARQDGIIIQEFKVEGPLERLHTLCADVARRLVSLDDSDFEFKAMNPSLEAEMLVHEAGIYQRRGQLDRALPALDGAFALAPDSVEIQRLLLRNRIAKKLGHGLKQDPRVGVDREKLHWGFTMAERILRHPSVPVSGSAHQDIETFQAISAFLNAVYISLSRKLAVEEHSSDFQETVSRYWELMALSRDVYAGVSPANHRRLLYHASQGLYITPDADESLRITDWILADYEAIDSEPIVISALVDAVKTFHSENPAGLDKIETYLHDLRGADRVDTRLTALKGSIRFYAHVKQDYGPAREFAQEYIDLAGRNQRINPRAISLHRFAEDDTANDVYRAEFLSEILRIAFDEDLLNLSTASRWVSCTLRLADHLENLNRPDEALEWVRRLMQVYDRNRSTQWQYLRDRAVALESRYFQEEAVPLPAPSRQKKPELMISHHDTVFADNGLHRIRFLRADHVNSFPVLLFSTGQEIGIVRFDGPDADSVSIQTHPRPLPNIDRRFIGAWERANDAVMAVHGNSVFVGLPNDGIVGFHPDGNIEVLNEDHGLAYNRIRHLAVLGDYLYAITGAVGEDSGILEIDLRTRQSRMLASSGSERRNPVLDGRRINGIAADPEHGVLWIYSSHNLLDNRYDPKIVRYTPRDQTYRIYEDEALTAFLRGSYSTDNAGSLGLFGNALLIRNGSGLYRLDLKDNSGEVLVKSFGRTTWDFPRRYSGHPVVLFEGGMASMVFDQLVLFKEGLRDPVFVPTEWFPHVGGRTPRIIRLFSSPGEILLLASNALYRIREPEKMY